MQSVTVLGRLPYYCYKLSTEVRFSAFLSAIRSLSSLSHRGGLLLAAVIACALASFCRRPPFDCGSRFLFDSTIKLALVGSRRSAPIVSRTLGGLPPSPSPSPSPENLLSPPAPALPPEVPSPAPTPSATPSPSPVPSHEEIRSGEVADQAGGGGEGGGMSGEKKAGIAMGVVLGVAVLAGGAVLYKKRQDNIRRSRYGYATRMEML